jgi:pilus assembly protein CpaB
MAAHSFAGRRGVALGIAVGLGALATIGIAGYVGSIESRALKGIEAVEAFVAKEIIPAGMSGPNIISGGLIARQPIPKAVLAEGSIRSLNDIKDKISSVTILKGEQILLARFAAPGGTKGVLPIPADRQALSVEVAIPPGVAGYIRAGDRVSIIAQLEGSGPGGEARVQYLLQSIEVLAIGQRVATEGQEQKSGGIGSQQGRVLMTLALTPVEAEKLVLSVLRGQVYFTLLPPDQQPVSTPGRTARDAFS